MARIAHRISLINKCSHCLRSDLCAEWRSELRTVKRFNQIAQTGVLCK